MVLAVSLIFKGVNDMLQPKDPVRTGGSIRAYHGPFRPCKITYWDDGKEMTAHGKFHAWGTKFEEFRNQTVVQVTCAIVEMLNGQIKELEPEQVKFLDITKDQAAVFDESLKKQEDHGEFSDDQPIGTIQSDENQITKHKQ